MTDFYVILVRRYQVNDGNLKFLGDVVKFQIFFDFRQSPSHIGNNQNIIWTDIMNRRKAVYLGDGINIKGGPADYFPQGISLFYPVEGQPAFRQGLVRVLVRKGIGLNCIFFPVP